jgi:6-phosphogluconolactonase/glucosamine-6-phosphate isomerase/deaminase
VLAAARALYLHIEGPEKKQVFEQIVRDDSAPVYSPLRVLMQHSSAPLAVYWCE